MLPARDTVPEAAASRSRVRAIMSAVYHPIINMPVKASNPPRVLQASPGSRSHPAVE